MLFLSHSGIDTDAAALLKRRIVEAAPAGFTVWFDKDDLEAGRPWQRQIEDAIAQSTCFAVYVGTSGVWNWVEAEVRVALDRAMVEPAYRFIPILANRVAGLQTLPAFARQFQAVEETNFDDILTAVFNADDHGIAPEAEPFFGLRAIDETRSHLFFGREQETAALVQRVFEQPLVLVSGDSGSGKSSLVRAGLVPQFRGGALAALRNERPDDRIWHVVIMRPRGRPWAELGDAVDESAKNLGVPATDRGALAEWAASGDINKVRRALRCGLPAEATRLLLVVDQFEELFTATPQLEREQFVAFLVQLAETSDDRIRIVLTMRHDYVNLCNSLEDLRARLDADSRRPRFQLGRMTDEGLERIVTEPLRLARIDETNRRLLARAIREEVGSRPGDLALVQMALTETWRFRHAHGGNLLAAYAAVGRVEGSLAKAAEEVRVSLLQTAAHKALAPVLDSVLVRLVRLGETGGATRRLAKREEFENPRWQLVQLLAADEGRRLVLVGGSDEYPTAEIAHEALVTAWPYFQSFLQSNATHKRILDALIPKAANWATNTVQERRERLVIGAELEWFGTIARERPDWLSADERALIVASQAEDHRRKTRDLWVRWGSVSAAGTLAALLLFAVWQYDRARDALVRINESLAASLWNRFDFAENQALSPDELTALWELRLSAPDLRAASMRELISKPDRAIRLGSRPDLVLRTLSFRWSPEEAESVFDSVLTAITRTTDPRQLEALARAAAATAANLTPAQVPGGINETVELLKRPHERAQLHAIAMAGWVLASRSTVDDAHRIAGTIVPLLAAADEYQIRAHAWILQALPGEMSPEWAETCLAQVLTAMATQNAAAVRPPPIREQTYKSLELPTRETMRLREDLAPVLDAIGPQGPTDEMTSLIEAIIGLSSELTGSQAERALTSLLKATSSVINAYQLIPFGSAIEALSSRLSPEQAALSLQSTLQTVSALETVNYFPPSIGNGVRRLAERLNPSQAQELLSTFVRVVATTSDQRQQQLLGSALQGISDKLTPLQARDALIAILRALSRQTLLGAFELYEAAPLLARRLTPAEATPVVALAMSALAPSSESMHALASVAAIEAMADLLTTEQAQAVVSAVLSRGIAEPADSTTIEANSAAIRALAPKLPAADAQRALSALLRAATEDGTGPFIGFYTKTSFEFAVQELAGRLTVDEAHAAMGTMWSGLKAVPAQSPRLMVANQLQWLTLQAVVKQATPQAAQAAFPNVLRGIEVMSGDPTSIRAQSAMIQAFADKLTGEQVEAGVASIVSAMSKATDIETLESLEHALQVLSGRLSITAREKLALNVRTILAWSSLEPTSVAAARVLAAALPRDRSEEYVHEMVEAMKYPTSAGQATTELLKALENAGLGAPGAAAGLYANLDWVARTYPSIDLEAPPACLPPARPNLVCPSVAR